MKFHGLCKAGVIPDFYGQIDKLDPKVWALHLDAFAEDELSPHAIFNECIPGLKMIDLSTFSEFRLAQLRSILKDIHRCRIFHGDIYPRNMAVQEGSNFALPDQRKDHELGKIKESWNYYYEYN